MALKNTNVGAGVIDLDYKGNVKVVIMNHSTNFKLIIEVGDKIAQFILIGSGLPMLSRLVNLIQLLGVQEALVVLTSDFFPFFAC